ncbi:GDPP1 phosphorylase, partial [Balaeniceps rex]|nr:GDPP1 phosphorylase [Balaeniceps rex]
PPRPQAVCSLRQPFAPRAFNFPRIRPGEVLLRLRRAAGGAVGPAPPDPLLVAINASPLERGHVLLLP